MSRGSNNLLFTPGVRRLGNGHSDSSPNNNDGNRRSFVPRPLSNPTEESGGNQDPWWLFEHRVRTGPYGLTGFPSQPHSPIRILVLDNQTSRTVNPRLRQFVRDSPPRIRGEWHMQLTAEEEEPLLTQEAFGEAMNKIKKQLYNPYSRRRARRRGLFSRNNNNNTEGEDSGDETKECAVCLETFVPNQEVLVTPCNHMFHSDCLVPWVRGHGQCPVCRFALCERRRENALALNNNNSGHNNENGLDVLMASELIALIRAMEEAFEFVNMSRY